MQAGATRAKQLGTERLGDLQTAAADASNPKQGVAQMELRFQAGALQDLSAAAARLRDPGAKLPNKDQAALTLLAISGLNRVKPATGQVFRHGGLFPGFKELNQVGATVVDMGFVSTARDQPGCIPGAVSHEVLEIITSKSGRDVSPLSLFGAGEREVLFKP